jgi:hypothetical protein
VRDYLILGVDSSDRWGRVNRSDYYKRQETRPDRSVDNPDIVLLHIIIDMTAIRSSE